MLLFHGTTVSNARQIIENGFSYNKSNWSCSEDKTYFFTEEYLKDNYGLDNREEIISYGVQEALQQSMIGLAVENPSDYRGAVLVFDSSLMNNKEEIEPDTSCPNMSDMAVAISEPDMNGLIGFYVMDENISSLRLITIASMATNQYLNKVSLNSIEEQLINVIRKSDNLLCNVSDIISQVTYSEEEINLTTMLSAA